MMRIYLNSFDNRYVDCNAIEVGLNGLVLDECQLIKLEDVIRIVDCSDTRFAESYAEVEYSDFDTLEAHEGCRFDDLNYLRRFER